MAGKATLVGIAGFFLKMGRIPQEQLTEFDRGFGADDTAPESTANKDRQVTTVVDMGVSEEHCPDLRSIEGEFLPVPLPELLRSLEQAAVDKKPRSFVGEQVTRACDSAGGSTKFYLHLSIPHKGDASY
jgi:hypothetical protein